MISGLVAGRISIAAGGVFAARLGLAIAIRYGYYRKQFGAPGKGSLQICALSQFSHPFVCSEVPIMSYLSHQRRLFPSLAIAYAHQIYLGKLKDVYVARTPRDAKKVFISSVSQYCLCSKHMIEIAMLDPFDGIRTQSLGHLESCRRVA